MNKKIITAYALTMIFSANVQAQEKWDLEKCISHAIENNLNIKQQEASKEQSAVELSTAKWSRLPDLNGGASHSFNFGRSIQADNTYKSLNTQNTSFNLNTSIPLFTGLKITNNIALAKLNLKAATEDLNKAKEDISIQVASAYLQILFNEELAQVAHIQVELSKEMLVQKEEYFKNGKASEAEWLEAKSRVAQDQLSAVQADNNYKLSLLDLSQLLELPSPENFSIVSPTYFPQLSFGAGLSTNYYKVAGMKNSLFGSQLRDNFSQYLGFQLTIPIFNRFGTRNQVRSARIQQNTLNWQLEDSKKALYKEIQQAYYNALGAESRYQSSITADKAAEASFNLMKEKYAEGKANATEYNESRTSWMKAISEKLQAKYDYIFRTKILDFYKGVPLTLK